MTREHGSVARRWSDRVTPATEDDETLRAVRALA